MMLPDGTLSFGGTDGWTRFNPLRMKTDSYEPAVALTNIKVNNKEVTQLKDSGGALLPVNAADHLILPFQQNTLNFEFGGTLNSASHKIYNTDTGWRDMTTTGCWQEIPIRRAIQKFPPENMCF